jgi:tetrahydromethanopterin S-methyltransferase subunit A
MVNEEKLLQQTEAELCSAMAAKKCWRCGCFQDTVNTLKDFSAITGTLGELLNEAQSLFEPKRYDCLGCEVCWPAVAQNKAAEIDPAIAEGGHCATQEPEIREGWPPLPGDYQVLRFQAPVAVCTLNSDHLIKDLKNSYIESLSVIGSLHTENLGIEHLIRNVLANPHIRYLIVCGKDTQKAIGHLPGQSLVALSEHGVNENMRIIEAKGKRPMLKNISLEYVETFRKQVQVINQIGEVDIIRLQELIINSASNDPGPFADALKEIISVPIEQADEPGKLILDRAGYFVVTPDRPHQQLVLEHYSNKGLLNRIFTASSAAALYTHIIKLELISRLDHAAYLGRELARAEHALLSGEEYVQDRAPGELDNDSTIDKQQEPTACGCNNKKGDSCN